MEGYPCSPLIVCRDQEGTVSPELRTLFLQEMIAHGVLMPWIAVSLSHNEAELDLTFNAVENALQVYQKALSDGVSKYLEGPVMKPVFRKYN